VKNACLILASLLMAAHPPGYAAANETPGEPVFHVSRYEVSGNSLLSPTLSGIASRNVDAEWQGRPL
jgi:hypothetical protein